MIPDVSKESSTKTDTSFTTNLYLTASKTYTITRAIHTGRHVELKDQNGMPVYRVNTTSGHLKTAKLSIQRCDVPDGATVASADVGNDENFQIYLSDKEDSGASIPVTASGPSTSRAYSFAVNGTTYAWKQTRLRELEITFTEHSNSGSKEAQEKPTGRDWKLVKPSNSPKDDVETAKDNDVLGVYIQDRSSMPSTEQGKVHFVAKQDLMNEIGLVSLTAVMAIAERMRRGDRRARFDSPVFS